MFSQIISAKPHRLFYACKSCNLTVSLYGVFMRQMFILTTQGSQVMYITLKPYPTSVALLLFNYR